MAKDWREFWNGSHSIYANDRHKQVHFDIILEDMRKLIHPSDHILDFGCGEALLAHELLSSCASLTLCDGAANVLAPLSKRFEGNKRVNVIAPEALSSVAPHSIDVVFVVSVLQYLSHDIFKANLTAFKKLLKEDGVIYIADVIPPDVGIIEDTISLLKMAFKHGFFIPACMSLVKTALSPYRKLRAKFGLTQFSKDQLLAFIQAEGFKAEVLAHNIGAHQQRFTVKVTL